MNEPTKIKSLWGDLPLDDSIRTPYIILKEQASILTEATNGLLVGNVVKGVSDDFRYDFKCSLKITVPLINNYSISIVDIFYKPNIYPLKISSSIRVNLTGVDEDCETEEQLTTTLKKILSSEQVKKIVSGLLNEVRLSPVKE